ncbi:MAG: hypothetical protein J6X61_00140 [Clostridia bacterium]|nr:hypothetical protein [Clostridia bacterium]
MLHHSGQTLLHQKDIEYYIELAKPLALPYSKQYELLGFLGDYATHDIASDWAWQNIGVGVMKMFTQGLITNKEVELYKEIDRSFGDMSLGGALCDETFWSLSGLQNHPLWDKQRKLAKTIIAALEQIRFDAN